LVLCPILFKSPSAQSDEVIVIRSGLRLNVIFVDTSDGLKANISNSGYSYLRVSVRNSPYAFEALYTLKYEVGI
jgi:hypothetical protein